MADTMVDIYNDYVGGAPSSTIVERLQNIPVEDIPQVRYDADGEFYEGGNSDNTVAAVSAVAYANHDDRDVFDAFMNLVKTALPELPAM